MSNWTVDELSKAGRALKVLRGATEGLSVELHLTDFDDATGPIRFCWEATPAFTLDPVTLPLRAAVALARLSGVRGWRIEGHPMAQVRKGDMESWLAADTFDREGRVDFPTCPFSIFLSERPAIGESDEIFRNLLFEQALEVKIAGEVRERLPAWVRFRNYHAIVQAAEGENSWKLRCSPGDNATREYLALTDDPPEL